MVAPGAECIVGMVVGIPIARQSREQYASKVNTELWGGNTERTEAFS
jgi:hypothetical protein